MIQARGSGLTLYEIARKMERRRELADRMAAYLDSMTNGPDTMSRVHTRYREN